MTSLLYFIIYLTLTNQILLASFADNTAILMLNINSDIVSQNLKSYLNKIEFWGKNGKIDFQWQIIRSGELFLK